MRVESLLDLPQMQVVLDMQRDLSAARSEAELIYHFATRLKELTGATLMLDLDVAGLEPGAFRLRDRIRIDDPGFSPATARANSRWDDPPDVLEIQTSPAISPLITRGDPRLAHQVPAEADPDLLGGSSDQWEILAVPIFHAGEVKQWLVVLAPAGTPVDPVQLRMGVSNLNVFSRAVAQYRLNRRVELLTRKLELGLNEVARIQQSILPRLPEVDGMNIGVHYRPAAIAGGDYYDFGRFDDGRLGVVVADVAGHGPGAAVVMAMLRTIMSSYRLGRSPADHVVRYANRLLVDGLTPGSFVTAVFLVIDTASGEAAYFNCGHCRPLLIRSDDRIETLEEGSAPPLGVLPELQPENGNFQLRHGESVVLFTDGITEAPARSGPERFGIERLEDILARRLAPDATLDTLASELDRFCGSTPRRDDECALILTRD